MAVENGVHKRSYKASTEKNPVTYASHVPGVLQAGFQVKECAVAIITLRRETTLS